MICCAQKGLTDHDLLSNHAQRLLKTKKKETHFNLNPIFSFFQFSLYWSSHTILIILYSTNIFRKKTSFFPSFFFIIFNTIYFFNSRYLFQTCQFFFLPIFIQHSKIYFQFFQCFQKNEYDTHFFNFSFFLFKIKHYPITRKEQNEKLFFRIFFRNSKHIFCFDKSQIFESQ